MKLLHADRGKTQNIKLSKRPDLPKSETLQDVIPNSADLSCTSTDAKEIDVGAGRISGGTTTDVMNKITPADISDPQEAAALGKVLASKLAAKISPCSKTQKMRSHQKKSILVVDDDSCIQILIKNILRGAGFKDIKTVSNGKAALKAMGLIPQASGETVDSNFDLVVLDVRLPDTNGFEICKKIRSCNRDIPVILISGYDIEEIQNKLIECGADDFLEKPFNSAELATRVKLLISRRRKRQDDARLAEFSRIKFNLNHSVPFIGDHINGYVILDPLGWGKDSLVYKVIETDTKKIYSLKMLCSSSIEKKDTVERFRNEVKIMSQIKHPKIVEFITSGYHDHCPYLVMEYIDGIDLEEYLVTCKRIPLGTFSRIAHDIASAISELHRNKIYHRDIKLKNILYSLKSNEAKLSDFGIAKMPESLVTTQEGFIVGTPIYLAPEIFLGEPATVQSDIYSYGATLYHLITGSPPFMAESPIELFKQLSVEKPPAIDSIRPGLPADLNTLIVDKCLAKKNYDRPSSMDEIQLEIERIFSNDLALAVYE